MAMTMELTADDTLWAEVLPASDLFNLLWVPHEFVRDVFGHKLADAFTIIYTDRVPAATANSFISKTGIEVSSGYLVSGISKTGLIMIEGKAEDLGGVTIGIPPSADGYESIVSDPAEPNQSGAIHGNTAKNCRRSAELLVAAIRHRTALAAALGSKLWSQKVMDATGAITEIRTDITYTFTFAPNPVIFYHGTKADMEESCHVGQYRSTGVPARLADGTFPAMPVQLTSYGVKSPNRP